ncbi:hypothetical protein [Demequina salsinemoris]|uniref:hypothetical protein n=1 Tax=Demequina salsinemoris TaxID=577470 RepID=UPI0007864D56|nr:hypothetical protein [Demequina salsinemoris]
MTTDEGRTEPPSDDDETIVSPRGPGSAASPDLPTAQQDDAEVDRTVVSPRRGGGRQDDDDATVLASRFAAPTPDAPEPLVVRAPRRAPQDQDATLPGSRRAVLRDDRVAGRRRVIAPPPTLTLHEGAGPATRPATTTPPSIADAPAGPPSPGSPEMRAQRARPAASELRSVSRRSRRGARATIAALIVVSAVSGIGLVALGVVAAIVLG